MELRVFHLRGARARLVGGLIVGAALACPTNDALAYCHVPVVAQRWSQEPHELRIPVYISIAPDSTVEHMGVSPDQAARWVIDVIARHNELVTAPKLYFVGFTQADFDPLSASPVSMRPAGITIQSFDCAMLEAVQICGDGAVACGGSGYANDQGRRVGVVTMNPVECEFINEQIRWNPIQDALISGANAKDPIRTMLHELGHVIGLQHTNQSNADCINMEGGVPGPVLGPNDGVMRSGGVAIRQRVRSWRRDDLDGIGALYEPYWSDLLSTPVWWPDDMFPDAPELSRGVELDVDPVRVAPVSTSATWADIQSVAWVDSGQRVRRVLLDSGGEALSMDTMVDPNASGLTWHVPTVALGREEDGTEYELVAWTSGETTKGGPVVPRWALRAIDGGDWAYFDGDPQFTSRLLVGFEDDSKQFVFAHFTDASTMAFTTVGVNGGVIENIDSGVEVLDIGTPACADGVCTFPVAAIDGPNPRFGRVEVSTGGGLSVSAPEFVSPALGTYGRVGLAVDSAGFYRAVAGRRRFRVEQQDPTATPIPQPLPIFLDGDWPLSSSNIVDNGSTVHGLVSAIANECGNGVLQDMEECDDGNTTPGDGCDASCLLEGDETGETGDSGDSGDSGGTGETGGLDDLGGVDGCGCALEAEDEPPLAWLWLVVLGITAGPGRRRQAKRQPRVIRRQSRREVSEKFSTST